MQKPINNYIRRQILAAEPVLQLHPAPAVHRLLGELHHHQGSLHVDPVVERGAQRLLRGAGEAMCLWPSLSGLNLGLNLTHRKLDEG